MYLPVTALSFLAICKITCAQNFKFEFGLNDVPIAITAFESFRAKLIPPASTTKLSSTSKLKSRRNPVATPVRINVDEIKKIYNSRGTKQKFSSQNIGINNSSLNQIKSIRRISNNVKKEKNTPQNSRFSQGFASFIFSGIEHNEEKTPIRNAAVSKNSQDRTKARSGSRFRILTQNEKSATNSQNSTKELNRSSTRIAHTSPPKQFTSIKQNFHNNLPTIRRPKSDTSQLQRFQKVLENFQNKKKFRKPQQFITKGSITRDPLPNSRFINPLKVTAANSKLTQPIQVNREKSKLLIGRLQRNTQKYQRQTRTKLKQKTQISLPLLSKTQPRKSFVPQQSENEVQKVKSFDIGRSPCARGIAGFECRMQLLQTALQCTSGKCHACQKCGLIASLEWIGCCRDHFLCCRPLARACQRCDRPDLKMFCNIAFGKCR